MYIHIPFCRAKCSYCDFNSFPGKEAIFADYAGAVAREMQQAGSLPVKTVYVGGGTPTVLPPLLLEQILATARACFDLSSVVEMTIEANPGTVGPSLLQALVGLGFTRLSVGVQSFDSGELSLLGRTHTPGQAIDAVGAARAAGFQQVSIDLIYGLPGQLLGTWVKSLELALSLRPEHVSLYALTLEEGTPLASRVAVDALPEPDPDLVADMYETAQWFLAAHGYRHYEISNWALSEGARCLHNLVYWRNEPYVGLGAGAHSWMAGRRRSNVTSPDEYVARMSAGEDPIAEEEPIPLDLEMGETMMLGLRLVQEGVEYARFRERFGVGLRERYGSEIEELRAQSLLVDDTQRVRLSERARLLGNQVFMRFLPG